MRRKFRCPPIIRFSFIRMLAAIQLDDEFLRWTCEIGDAVADGMLAMEFVQRNAFA